MKKHVALTLLLLTTLGVINAHVDLPEVDGRRFVLAQGKLHDPLGWFEDQWTQSLRRCGAVRRLDSNSNDVQASLRAIQAFSPPDSQSARLLQVLAHSDWLLAEVEFERLNPAVVLLRKNPTQVQVVGDAVWSGSTEPWRPAPLIRRHLSAKAPELPRALLECFTPSAAPFQRL